MVLIKNLRIVHAYYPLSKVAKCEIQVWISLTENRSVINDFSKDSQLLNVKDKTENEVAAKYETHKEVKSKNLETFLAASSTFSRFLLIFVVFLFFILINNLRLFL